MSYQAGRGCKGENGDRNPLFRPPLLPSVLSSPPLAQALVLERIRQGGSYPHPYRPACLMTGYWVDPSCWLAEKGLKGAARQHRLPPSRLDAQPGSCPLRMAFPGVLSPLGQRSPAWVFAAPKPSLESPGRFCGFSLF
ncbi:hypothetical protein MTBLM1_80247 [Rhodospirillaceae bacterium LM-1]|nr:hypothetical protein MTBLM1_80247 [Rhodospirillaceae bacterium LM-1]